MNKPIDNNYVTYLYRANPSCPHFRQMPEINGKLCVGIYAGDIFNERDDAYSFIAKLAHCDHRGALQFLKDRGYEHTYQTLIVS